MKRESYGLFAALEGDTVVEYHRTLVHGLSQEFGLRALEEQAFEPHLTLKYGFEASEAEYSELKQVLEEFAASHSSAGFVVEGFGFFDHNVIFLEVQPSIAVQTLLLNLTTALRGLEWMQWNEFDGDNLYLHVTIAVQCLSKFEAAMRWLKGREQRFETRLTNVSIARDIGTVNEIPKLVVEKRLRLTVLNPHT